MKAPFLLYLGIYPKTTLILAAISLSIGILVVFKPSRAADLQNKLHEKLGWKIEPTPPEKELRDTKRLGIYYVLLGVATIAYVLIRNIL